MKERKNEWMMGERIQKKEDGREKTEERRGKMKNGERIKGDQKEILTDALRISLRWARN